MRKIISSLSNFLPHHIYYSRVLWWATSSLSNAAYNRGSRDKTFSHQVISPEKVDESALTFNQLVHIYRSRTTRGAALMILISFVAFWRHQARIHEEEKKFKDYELICAEAVKELAIKEYHQSDDPLKGIEEAIQEEERKFSYKNQNKKEPLGYMITLYEEGTPSFSITHTYPTPEEAKSVAEYRASSYGWHNLKWELKDSANEIWHGVMPDYQYTLGGPKSGYVEVKPDYIDK